MMLQLFIEGTTLVEDEDWAVSKTAGEIATALQEMGVHNISIKVVSE